MQSKNAVNKTKPAKSLNMLTSLKQDHSRSTAPLGPIARFILTNATSVATGTSLVADRLLPFSTSDCYVKLNATKRDNQRRIRNRAKYRH